MVTLLPTFSLFLGGGGRAIFFLFWFLIWMINSHLSSGVVCAGWSASWRVTTHVTTRASRPSTSMQGRRITGKDSLTFLGGSVHTRSDKYNKVIFLTVYKYIKILNELVDLWKWALVYIKAKITLFFCMMPKWRIVTTNHILFLDARFAQLFFCFHGQT